MPDPENMLTMLYTWQSGDCSQQDPYNGDFAAAMQGIKAKALVLPGQTDLYFPYVHRLDQKCVVLTIADLRTLKSRSII